MRSPRRKRQKIGRNPEQTQKRIIAAALKEFAAHGFAGARVDSIARAARINKRMLYHYFHDKEGLFREVLRYKIAERKAWMSSAPANPFEALPQWFKLMWQDPEWIRLLQWEALQWGDAEVIDEEHRRESFAQGVAHLKKQQASGVVPADLDPAQLLLSLLALTAYPVAFPHLARLATGLRVSDPEFEEQRSTFLQRFGRYFQQMAAGAS